ncbi:MAG: PfkB family carbohydrate kinase [Saccharofermentanales bacterium]|jgi:2-dehydro-3-deoxygluconokinase
MRVVSFGEILLRLAAPGYTKLFQKDSLDATFCGGEANVAVSLSIFGADSVFVTKLPDTDIGHAAAHALDYFKVDTTKIVYGNGRMGLYYFEKGASQRPSKVIYDRAYSSIALAKRNEFDWNNIFDGADWFHWTGINPALSDELADICLIACEKAKEIGITVSCDLNYRGKLWTSERAQKVMKPLMKYVDVCICNEEDADKVLGIIAEGTDVESGKLNDAGYVRTAEMIYNYYGCRYIATTLRKSYSASRNGWRAMLYDAEALESYFSQEYDIQLVDRVGGGDSFSAGLIYAIGTGMDYQDALDFATAASCLKQTIEGDFNRTTLKEVETLLKSGGNGRVQR